MRDRLPFSVCLIYTFDPRGNKIGGLETYSRDFIEFHPRDCNLLVIGVDSTGDLKLGETVDIEFRGRQIKFMPVVRYPETEINRAAKKLGDSLTFQFSLGLLRFLPRIRSLLRKGRYTIDSRRVELGPICWALGVPYIQMMHTEGAPHLEMDSIVKSYRWAYNALEALTLRTCELFLCVNPFITQRMRKEHPAYADKIDTLTTWFNPNVYKATPFRLDDDVFRIVFCGRLDSFKSPPLMFKTLRKIWEKRGGGGVEFHYVGASEPERFSEFQQIREFSILHGFRSPLEIAEIHKAMHAGILTSVWEGMPRCVLETSGSGRPTGAINLPQLESVIHDGVSGYLVPRLADDDMMAEELSQRFIDIWNGIRAGTISPEDVASLVQDFTPQRLLGRVFDYHRRLAEELPLSVTTS